MDRNVEDIDSEVMAFGDSNSLEFFGFEAYETTDNVLASVGVLTLNKNCYEDYVTTAGENFIWKK